MKYNLALAGNPNCGKTTLFNILTGSKQHVGNWPGVTVDKKEGVWRKHSDFNLLDLPGTYSLSPYSEEEKIARDYIVKEKPDCVIDIVESPNLERNLYLTLQILETGVPTVIALNMSDELEQRGETIDSNYIEKEFGVKVVKISARNNHGIDDLYKAVKETIDKGITPKKLPLFEKLKNLDDEQIANARYEKITSVVKHCYKKNKEVQNTETKSSKIDRILTNKVLGLPIFAVVMYLLFQISLGENLFFVGIPGLGIIFAGWVETIWEILTNFVASGLVNAAPWAQGLVIDGIFGGIGAVLGFMPLVLVLYMLLSILEDSGYMARVAFVLDRIFRKFGLSGKSFIPLLMGFGCGVPAIMATRTLDEEKDRHITTIITAFMPCGAKLPIIALFVSILFSPDQAANITFLIYAIALCVAILVSLVLNKVWYKGAVSNFLMELPQYRWPTPISVLQHSLEKIKGFARKAGTIILASTILIWFLTNFNVNSFNGVNQATNENSSVMSEMDDSFMASVGKVISPIFNPLGFSGWRPTVGIITGWIAKENVVATFAQVYDDDISDEYLSNYFDEGNASKEALAEAGFEDGVYDSEVAREIYDGILAEGGDHNALPTVRRDIPTKSSGFAYIMFNLLCMPCFAAVGSMHRELKTWRKTLGGVGVQMLTAYIVALIIRLVGLLFGF
ncbi:MAG: ferrous iron transport protein B [Sphaerochaetaceae bacterium]|nr:ferrous iron transport protein B [Sphaerochaetaceae bacterium]